MKTLITSLIILSFAALVAFRPSPTTTYQITPDYAWVMQNGQKVAEIYIPPRPATAKVYKEYWYISKDYIYPSLQTMAEILIKPVDIKCSGVQEFRQKMEAQWPDGRMIVVDATEE